MSETFDLIVVGAGPAGSSCARRAAELGLKVVVLERATFPRAKPCGAGLTDKALSLLGGEQEPVEQRSFRSAEIAFGNYLSLIVDSRDVLVTTTSRRELDALLARAAETAGARIDFGRTAGAPEVDGAVVRIASGSDSMRASHVVVADGARGVGRRSLGLDPVRLGGGLYVRARPPSGELPEHLTDRVLFDPTAVSRGYAWIFPKRDHLNIGVFSQRELSDGLRSDLDAFLELRGFAGWRSEGPFAYPIPVDRPADALGTERVLFAGDAAGLANPVTGEGISSAILSGRVAAEAVAASLGSGVSAAAAYSRSVEKKVVPMIDSSRRKGEFVYGLGAGFLGLAARTPVLRAMIPPALRAATRGNGSLLLRVAEPRRRSGAIPGR